MRPILQDNKISRKLWAIYISIFSICTIGIIVALYAQFANNEKPIIYPGNTIQTIDEEDKKLELQEDFNSIFNNNLEVFQEDLNIEKLNSNFDIIVTAYSFEEENENKKINAHIPYLNINDNSAIQLNAKIKEEYKEKAELLKEQTSNISIIYTVEYKAYIQNNILSLAICSEFKEGEQSQKTIIQTFNYNLVEKRQVTLEEILNLKNITKDDANKKIKDEIKTVQEQNEALIQALAEEQRSSVYQRDYNSDKYDVSNSNQFLYGKNGILYVIYSYGNEMNTNEKDVVIFE